MDREIQQIVSRECDELLAKIEGVQGLVISLMTKEGHLLVAETGKWPVVGKSGKYYTLSEFLGAAAKLMGG